jgi:hypothetical protein
MSDEKYFKVIVTSEYIVKANSSSDAIKNYIREDNLVDTDEHAYELTENDLKNYEIR